LHVPDVNVILMMNIDGKGGQEDLSSDQKVVLKALADHFQREILRRANPAPAP
jgi:hypothetical protein